jgi:nicotinate-nucleotide adenylyltransferase
VTGLVGGRFDPPHLGHVGLVRAALEQLALDRLVVLVSARPGHKPVVAAAEARLELARAAIDGLAEVELDEHAFTVDLLRARAFDDPVFVIGADQLAAFRTWKEPDEVLRLSQLAVAARPGYDPPEAPAGGRILVFTLDPIPISSSEIRARVARGERIDGLVPPRVAELIRELGLYTHAAPERTQTTP